MLESIRTYVSANNLDHIRTYVSADILGWRSCFYFLVFNQVFMF